MMMVRHFTTGLTRAALKFLDEEITEWIKEDEVTVKEVEEFYALAPTGMSGAIEHCLVLSVWYESQKAEKAGTKDAAQDIPHYIGPQHEGSPGQSTA